MVEQEPGGPLGSFSRSFSFACGEPGSSRALPIQEGDRRRMSRQSATRDFHAAQGAGTDQFPELGFGDACDLRRFGHGIAEARQSGLAGAAGDLGAVDRFDVRGRRKRRAGVARVHGALLGSQPNCTSCADWEEWMVCRLGEELLTKSRTKGQSRLVARNAS